MWTWGRISLNSLGSEPWVAGRANAGGIRHGTEAVCSSSVLSRWEPCGSFGELRWGASKRGGVRQWLQMRGPSGVTDMPRKRACWVEGGCLDVARRGPVTAIVFAVPSARRGAPAQLVSGSRAVVGGLKSQ